MGRFFFLLIFLPACSHNVRNSDCESSGRYRTFDEQLACADGELANVEAESLHQQKMTSSRLGLKQLSNCQRIGEFPAELHVNCQFEYTLKLQLQCPMTIAGRPRLLPVKRKNIAWKFDRQEGVSTTDDQGQFNIAIKTQKDQKPKPTIEIRTKSDRPLRRTIKLTQAVHPISLDSRFCSDL